MRIARLIEQIILAVNIKSFRAMYQVYSLRNIFYNWQFLH